MQASKMVTRCSRRLPPFVDVRECGAPAAAVLECRPFGEMTHPAGVLRVVFCATHRDEYLSSDHGWKVVEAVRS